MEIERKFLLRQRPDLPVLKEMDIYQGYLSFQPEVRIRSRRVLSGPEEGRMDYFLTIKGQGDLAREEVETQVPEDFFRRAAALLPFPMIHKHYTCYEHEGYLLECSLVDEGEPTSFLYGEVEFDDRETALAYQWPFPGAQDITYDKEYKMSRYCKKKCGEIS